MSHIKNATSPATLLANDARELALYREVFGEIPDCIILKDEQGNFLLCNQTVARLYNTTPQAMVGKHDGDFGVPPEMAEFFRQNVLGIMARGQTEVVFEESRDAATGAIRHFKSIKRPFKDADGRCQILVIAHDITDVVQAQQRTAQSERRLQEVMEATQEGIWDWHLPTGRVIHNARWYNILGFAQDEIIDHIDAFSQRLHPEDKPRVWKELESILAGAIDDYHSEHRMLRKDGSVIWVQDRGRVAERDTDGQPLRMVGAYADITVRKTAEEEIRTLAHYDPLTRLPNRRLLLERLHRALLVSPRLQRKAALLFIDLDNFKTLNDSQGHDKGDLLLQQVAQRLLACVRENDTVARIGGDEFVVLLENLSESEEGAATQAEMLSRKIVTALSQPYLLDDYAYHGTMSMGVTLFGDEPVTIENLLKQADLAMYQAKAAGRNGLRFFDPQMQANVTARAFRVMEPRVAVRECQFCPHYQ